MDKHFSKNNKCLLLPCIVIACGVGEHEHVHLLSLYLRPLFFKIHFYSFIRHFFFISSCGSGRKTIFLLPFARHILDVYALRVYPFFFYHECDDPPPLCVCRIHNVRMIFPFRIVYNPFNFSVLAFSNQLILSFFFLFLG
jgi:hypothetical protein